VLWLTITEHASRDGFNVPVVIEPTLLALIDMYGRSGKAAAKALQAELLSGSSGNNETTSADARDHGGEPRQFGNLPGAPAPIF